MKKTLLVILIIGSLAFILTACRKNNGNASSERSSENNGQEIQIQSGEHAENSSEAKASQTGDPKILIAYFSRVGNTDFPRDVDATSSASLVVKDGELYGNTQFIATQIQQHMGGDLFLIETEEKYPADYDETDRQGETENRERARPKLATHVENINDYDIVFLGYPVWYYDMPMAVYTFLEEYDLSGKTIVPFATSGGSGFLNTISEIQDIQPEAKVLTDGFEVSHSRIEDVTSEDIKKWIDGLPLA